ncbi:MAG TPA: PD-(D/E)XK nuclease family protein [Pirellulales bacterium]|nr:PD-(D/E)XK nuclease family protein [Pirellulales bacterium]
MKTPDKPHLSASQLDMISKCPEQWRRRYVEGEVIPPGIAALKGKAVHRPAEINFRQKIETHDDLPVKEFIDLAADAFEAELAGGYLLTPEEEVRGRKTVLGEAKDATVKMAIFHATDQAPDYQPELVEQQFRIALPGPHDLVGVIDMADDARRVVDLKTSGKAKSQGDADGSIQLTAYAAGYRVLTGEQPTELRLDTIVQTAKTTRRDVVSTARGPADFRALAARLNVVERQIESGIFPPAPVGAWYCGPKYCGYWSTCKFVNAEREAANGAD